MKLLNFALSVLHDLRTISAGNAGASTAGSSAGMNHPISTEELAFHLDHRDGFKAKAEASIFTGDQECWHFNVFLNYAVETHNPLALTMYCTVLICIYTGPVSSICK